MSLWCRSDWIQVFCCSPKPHCLGNPTVEFLGDIALLLVLLINANLCKSFSNFLLFPNGALYHLNFKFQALDSQKMLLRNVWSIPLQKCSKIMKWKIFEAFTRVHMWNMSQYKNKWFKRLHLLEGGSQDYTGSRNHNPARPKILGTTANSQSVLILSAC